MLQCGPLLALLAASLPLACGDSSSPGADDAGPTDDAATPDADAGPDADTGPDADALPDSTPDGEPDGAPDADVAPDAEPDAADDVAPPDDAPDDGAIDEGGGPDVPPGHFVVATINTGTTEGTTHDVPGDVYGEEQSGYSDTYYGDGAAWVPAVEALRAWLNVVRPDLVAFQEIFYSEHCPEIPAEARVGFVCETWAAGDPTVAQVLLGSGYQIACHPGKDDKCLAVRKDFGRIRQCPDDDFCLEGLDGATVSGCGSGSRIGRGTIDLVGGGELTVISVHGTSGVMPEDMECRRRQVEQIFENLDGEPAVNGSRHVILGDFNVDPCRVPEWLDESSNEWNRRVGGGEDFQWVSPCGALVPPTYAGTLNIDHVVSDVFDGDCWVPGVTAGHPAAYEPAYFDHKPLVCELRTL
jgi:hypothetical protein